MGWPASPLSTAIKFLGLHVRTRLWIGHPLAPKENAQFAGTYVGLCGVIQGDSIPREGALFNTFSGRFAAELKALRTELQLGDARTLSLCPLRQQRRATTSATTRSTKAPAPIAMMMPTERPPEEEFDSAAAGVDKSMTTGRVLRVTLIVEPPGRLTEASMLVAACGVATSVAIVV